MSEDLEAVDEAHRRWTAAFKLQRHHSAKTVEQCLRNLVVGMRRQARVVHLRKLGTFRAPIGDAHRVLVLPLHAYFERLKSALQQPAPKWIGRLTPDHHLATHFVDQRLVAADDAGEKIVMAVEKLCR